MEGIQIESQHARRYLRRRVAAYPIAGSQLAATVSTPAPKRSVAPGCAGVALARPNVLPILFKSHALRCAELPGRGRAEPELVATVSAPTVERAAHVDGASMPLPGCDALKLEFVGDLERSRRGWTLVWKWIGLAQLAFGVGTPTVESSASLDGADMFAAYIERLDGLVEWDGLQGETIREAPGGSVLAEPAALELTACAQRAAQRGASAYLQIVGVLIGEVGNAVIVARAVTQRAVLPGTKTIERAQGDEAAMS